MNTPPISSISRYQAVNGRLSTAGQPTEAELASVAGEGFRVVINLGLHNQPRYSLRDEPGIVQSLGMAYVHIPVQFEAPTESDLLAFFEAMDRHKEEKVLVHCAANMRVTAFLGLHRAIQEHQPIDEAFALMKSIWEPNAVWSSFIAAMLAKHRGRPAVPTTQRNEHPTGRSERLGLGAGGPQAGAKGDSIQKKLR